MKRYQIARDLIKVGVVPKEFLRRFDSYMSRIPEHSRFPKSKKDAYDKPLADKILLQLDAKGMKTMKKQVEEAINSPEIHKRFFITDALMDNLDKFFEPEAPNFYWNINYKETKEFVYEWLKPFFKDIEAIELSDDMDVREIITNLKAQAGSISLNDKKEDCLDIIKAVAFYIYHEKPNLQLPAILYSRSQMGGYLKTDINGVRTVSAKGMKYKSRVVWCIDAATIMVEGTIARPMMEVLCKVQQYAGGKMDSAISHIVRGWNNHFWISVDYSSYDSSIPSWLIHDIFTMIKRWFGNKHDELISWIENQFINTTFYDYRGKLRSKTKGVPSGSYFTQIVDSLANYILILTWMRSKYGDFNVIKSEIFENNTISMCVMGDDNIIFTKVPLNMKHLASYLDRNFGIEMHPDKCDKGTCNESPKFLKRAWTAEGSDRDLLELLIEAIHSERFRAYKKKGFSPWHVIFGYYMSYPVAMKKLFTLTEIMDGMKRHGGIIRIKSMGLQNMPGSMKVHVMTNSRYFDELIEDAEIRQKYENHNIPDAA